MGSASSQRLLGPHSSGTMADTMAKDIPSVQTPSSRFNNLPDFPYEPRYLENGSLQMAYIDERSESPSNGEDEVYLCLHGQPTWSYLYRRMIPVLLGHQSSKTQQQPRRVIAPDLFGFGRSSKPTREEDYTYTFHRDSLLYFIEKLDLRNITLIVQDWGGLLGLTLPIAFPWRFKRFIVMNTSLAVGKVPSEGFTQWRAYNNRTPDMDIGALMKRSCPHLSQAEADAYNAPFPDKSLKSGVRRFPNLVMTDPSMEGVEISKESARMYATSNQWKAEDVFMACGLKDPVLGEPVMRDLAQMWKNGCHWMAVEDGGHFTQEWGGQIARRALETFQSPGSVEGVAKISPASAKM